MFAARRSAISVRSAASSGSVAAACWMMSAASTMRGAIAVIAAAYTAILVSASGAAWTARKRPPGLIAHLAWRTESGLRYVDVWSSKDDYEAFAEHRLHPVVRPILPEMLGFVPPEPPSTVLDVIDAWTGRHPA